MKIVKIIPLLVLSLVPSCIGIAEETTEEAGGIRLSVPGPEVEGTLLDSITDRRPLLRGLSKGEKGSGKGGSGTGGSGTGGTGKGGTGGTGKGGGKG